MSIPYLPRRAQSTVPLYRLGEDHPHDRLTFRSQYKASRVSRKIEKAMLLLRGASPFVRQFGGFRDRGCELYRPIEHGKLSLNNGQTFTAAGR